ncbi:hypothetical protein ISS22_13520 [candidate division KSB1 bacterium]|nr:hypothetical protein [candidate division KSB1 bacterium]
MNKNLVKKMILLQKTKLADLFQQTEINNLRAMVAYAYNWTNLPSCHTSFLPEFIDTIYEFFGIPRWNNYYQRIVVPIKVPEGLH